MEACIYFTIGLFILAGRSSAALEVNGKGKGRILNKGKAMVAVVAFENWFLNSISGTVSRVG